MKEFDLKSSLDSLELLREGIRIIRSDNVFSLFMRETLQLVLKERIRALGIKNNVQD